jgi:TrmH family RNA methyltransferase
MRLITGIYGLGYGNLTPPSSLLTPRIYYVLESTPFSKTKTEINWENPCNASCFFVPLQKEMSIMDNYLSSTQNPRIKKLLALQQKSALRRETGLFVVEGRREIQHCIEAGYEIDTLFVRENKASTESALSDYQAREVFKVSDNVYERIAYRGSTEGVIAEVRAKQMQLADLSFNDNPLLMILERVEKPGNLGAILRSADAAGATAVIVCDLLTDLYNPNLIRASLGAVFSVPCVVCSSEECIQYLKDHHIRILTAQLQDSSLYYDTDMTGATAIVMGTESTGLTDQWRKAADAHIRIPMAGQLDSLNVSVSAAVLLYEAVRQRFISVGNSRSSSAVLPR